MLSMLKALSSTLSTLPQKDPESQNKTALMWVSNHVEGSSPNMRPRRQVDPGTGTGHMTGMRSSTPGVEPKAGLEMINKMQPKALHRQRICSAGPDLQAEVKDSRAHRPQQ